MFHRSVSNIFWPFFRIFMVIGQCVTDIRNNLVVNLHKQNWWTNVKPRQPPKSWSGNNEKRSHLDLILFDLDSFENTFKMRLSWYFLLRMTTLALNQCSYRYIAHKIFYLRYLYTIYRWFVQGLNLHFFFFSCSQFLYVCLPL